MILCVAADNNSCDVQYDDSIVEKDAPLANLVFVKHGGLQLSYLQVNLNPLTL